MKRAAILITSALLLAACGSSPVRRVSEPAASIQQLTVRADGSWSLDLRLNNYSSVPMRFDNLQLALRVGGQTAGHLQASPGLSVGPEAADVASVRLAPTVAAKLLVADALARGGRVEYALEGSLNATPQDGRRRSFEIDQRSALSPVPGLTGVLR